MTLVGSSLADRYDILALIGEGGMGAVYRARDRELDEIVALKVIRAELARDPAIVERFRSEVKLARRVTHGNVARTFELGNADGILFATMELVEGESLTERMRRMGKLPVADAVAIAAALCDGLAAAHAVDVVHRDIKPDNVLLAADGRVVIADFGVAVVRAPTPIDLSGTPAYMAPEQASGAPATPAVDVYAVGILLYEMVTGRKAFAGDVARVLTDKLAFERVSAPHGELPAGLGEVIEHATAREPARRIASAVELRHELAPWGKPAAAVAQPVKLVAFGLPPGAITVSVPPPTGEPDRLYLAEAVHEEVVARVGKLPRVRVRPRTYTTADVDVTFVAGDDLAVSIARGDDVIARMSLPLAVDQIERAAATITDAVASAIAQPESDHGATDASEALDLMFRARHLAAHDLRQVNAAMKLLGEAADLAPTHPRIIALLAIAQVRLAFFIGEGDPTVLSRAAEMARAAVAAAPNQVTAHLAMGHVELNLGEPTVAAGHFRVAIACAPHSAEAHEQLGRMLLEAGYLDQAIARLEDAIALNPATRSARWEIARAWALEGRWADHKALVAELVADDYDRAISRARYAWWQRDHDALRELRGDLLTGQQIYVPGLLTEFVSTFLDDVSCWPAHRDAMRATIAALPPIRRRRAFDGQIIAEAAAYHGDIATALEMIEFATGEGLFDLHWLDRCPLFDDVRRAPEFSALRMQVKRRADGILDALYGDHDLGTSATVVSGTR